jgi:hypothetical protein
MLQMLQKENKMDALIGLGLVIYSIGMFVYKQFFSDGLTSQSIIQIAVAGIGALVILAPKFLSFIMGLKIPEKEKEDDIKLDDAKDYQDFVSLNYLKDRAIELRSEEALELVIKLNTLIFSVKNETES